MSLYKLNIWYKFHVGIISLGGISQDFKKVEQSEISLNDFS